VQCSDSVSHPMLMILSEFIRIHSFDGFLKNRDPKINAVKATRTKFHDYLAIIFDIYNKSIPTSVFLSS